MENTRRNKVLTGLGITMFSALALTPLSGNLHTHADNTQAHQTVAVVNAEHVDQAKITASTPQAVNKDRQDDINQATAQKAEEAKPAEQKQETPAPAVQTPAPAAQTPAPAAQTQSVAQPAATTQAATAPAATQSYTQPAAAAPVQAAPQAPAVNGNVGAKQAVVDYAKQLSTMGIPYVWGGSSLGGMDCSGFTNYVYQHAAGVSLGHYTGAQETQTTRIPVSQAQPGDLLFWGTPGASYHVGIYIGNGQYIAAPTYGMTVSVQSMSGFYPDFAGSVNM